MKIGRKLRHPFFLTTTKKIVINKLRVKRTNRFLFFCVFITFYRSKITTGSNWNLSCITTLIGSLESWWYKCVSSAVALQGFAESHGGVSVYLLLYYYESQFENNSVSLPPPRRFDYHYYLIELISPLRCFYTSFFSVHIYWKLRHWGVTAKMMNSASN